MTEVFVEQHLASPGSANKVYIWNYQCFQCDYESGKMDKMIQHLTEKHVCRVKYVRCWKVPAFAMQKCILYKLEIQCPSCELGTTAENSKIDLFAAMEQFGDWKLDEVIQNFSM